MMKEGSFTDWVKDEIFDNLKTKEEQKIMLFMLLWMNGIMKNDFYLVNSLNLIIKTRLLIIIEELLSTSYQVKIFKKSFSLQFNQKKIEDFFELNNVADLFLNDAEKEKAILIGVFLSGGWINSPLSKFYHLEIKVNNSRSLSIIKSIFKKKQIRFKFFVRNQKTIIYIKKASEISDFLKIINASESLLYFEDERITRDMIASIAKSEKIEKYNLSKTLLASRKHIWAFEKIKKFNKEDLLTANEKLIIILRMQNKDISLNDLAYLFNRKYHVNYSKSTINNWLNKIIKKAQNF